MSVSSSDSAKRVCTTETCCTCKREFPGKQSLYDHVEAAHVSTWTKGYVCNWNACAQVSASKSAFRAHMCVHTGECRFMCTECDAAFTTKGAMKIHIRRKHTGERPYPCTECDYAFVSSGDRDEHMRRWHTGERPHKCKEDECDKAFITKSALDIHMREHTGERFKCTEHGCNKEYITKACLAVHLRLHTGEFRFRCTECDAAFTTKAALEIHIRRKHTGERPYPCTECDYAFVSSGERDGHMRRWHTDPRCHACGVRPIASDTNLCGYCYVRAGIGGPRERKVFEFLARFDDRLGCFVRDQTIGGLQLRPDGYMELIFDNVRVMFIVEVDDKYHCYIKASREVERLQRIHDGYGGALYVLRYNPDQPDGLSDSALEILAWRCMDILGGEAKDAVTALGCIIVEYIGYPESRVRELDQASPSA
jgi:hypothetical protein